MRRMISGHSRTDRQCHEHRRGGLLPRQRVRRHRSTIAVGRHGEPRRAQHRAAARHLRRVRSAQHVLRARLGRRASSRTWYARSPSAGTRSRRTVTPTASSTIRRRKAFRDDVRRAQGIARGFLRTAGVSGTARRATRSRHDRCGRIDILIEEGYSYDSSIFPIRHDRYGIPVSGREPYAIHRDCGSLVEVPGSTTQLGTMNLPVAGGGYFRILPYWWTRWGISRVNQPSSGRQCSTCIRGRSIPTSRGSRPAGSARFRHYRNLHSTEARFRQLLTDFRFGTMERLVSDARRTIHGPSERRTFAPVLVVTAPPQRQQVGLGRTDTTGIAYTTTSAATPGMDSLPLTRGHSRTSVGMARDLHHGVRSPHLLPGRDSRHGNCWRSSSRIRRVASVRALGRFAAVCQLRRYACARDAVPRLHDRAGASGIARSLWGAPNRDSQRRSSVTGISVPRAQGWRQAYDCLKAQNFFGAALTKRCATRSERRRRKDSPSRVADPN